MITYQRESMATADISEVMPLAEKHYAEIAHFKDIPLDPDVEGYRKLDENGALRIYTARNEGHLIGYSVYFVRHNIHYKGSLQAVQDILFIDPNHRGFGAKFILWCDSQLKEEGVEATYHHVKSAHNFGPMLERLGYKLIDLIYARRLN